MILVLAITLSAGVSVLVMPWLLTKGLRALHRSQIRRMGYQPREKRAPRGRIVTTRFLWGLYSRMLERDRVYSSWLWGAFVRVREQPPALPPPTPPAGGSGLSRLSPDDRIAFASIGGAIEEFYSYPTHATRGVPVYEGHPRPDPTSTPGPGSPRRG